MMLIIHKKMKISQKLNKYKAKVYIDRKIRSMKRRLSFNNATHDAQYLTTMQYVYYLLNGGQHRRNQTSDIYDSNDYSVQALLSGHSEVTQDGEITFYKTDLMGNLIPNSEVNINTGMYRYDQKDIPKLLADNLDPSTLQKLEAGDALFGRKSTFTTEDFLNLDNALANAKKQAKNILDIKKNQYYENLLDTENKLAKNAAPSIFDAPLTSYAERNMLAYYKVNSIEELTETYASFGMVTPIPDGETGIVALNGYEDYDYIMGVAGFDASGNYVSCGSFSFHSDFADESLPLPGDMTIDVSEITESTARVKYVMGENTRAYYQAVMTVADYNELVEYGATLPDYDNPEDYVRDYVAVYGTTLFADDDYVWPNLLSGTDYVAVGYPMNGNGTFGYGASAKAEFTTAGTAPASVKGQSPVSRKTNVIRPLTLQEIKEVLGK